MIVKRLLIGSALLALLGGCATYDDGYNYRYYSDGYGYRSYTPYYGYRNDGYRSNDNYRYYDRRYNGDRYYDGWFGRYSAPDYSFSYRNQP